MSIEEPRSEDHIISDARVLLNDATKPYLFSEKLIQLLFSLGLTTGNIARSDSYSENVANRLIEFIITNANKDGMSSVIHNPLKLLNNAKEAIRNCV